MIDRHMALPDMLPVDSAAAAVSQVVHNALVNSPPVVLDITEHLSKAAGKGIRTNILINSASQTDATVSKDAVMAAAAIEILHMATLVHDDIIDDAAVRRGIPSVQSKFGKKQAVICGDYLLGKAVSTVLGIYERHTSYVSDFAAALNRLVLGEMRQCRNLGNTDLSYLDYLRIISGKTAALFYISARSGAVIGGSGADEISLLSLVGQNIGIIFQIMDDCKDYELTEQESLKTAKIDIAQGVVTLPLIAAMTKEPMLKDLAANVFKGAVDPGILIKKVFELGGTDSSKAVARRYAAKTDVLIDRLSPHKQSGFRQILRLALGGV